MQIIPYTLIALLLSSNIWVLSRYLEYRRRLKQRGFIKNWPIPLVLLDQFDSIFKTTELGPTLDTEVRFVGKGNLNVFGGTTDAEAWIISVLAKRSLNMFEFGTCTGKTTYLMALNSSENARVTTLTLSPNQVDQYDRKNDDYDGAIADALNESIFTKFLYTGTKEEKKITQLFGDSKHFDETEYKGKIDLIFIDGSHAYSYVMSDSEKAFRMLSPNGIILWHDYRGPRETKDVFRALNEINKTKSLVHIKETSLVAYKNIAGVLRH